MGSWNYPAISLEDFMKSIKGFVDMMIIASGYQSSGRLAYWDSANIKKALQWALFIEDVIGCLSSQDDYTDSLDELDIALCEMKSNPHFPKGLEHLSSKNLNNARCLMLERLTHALPLRDSHLRALLTAAVEMDSNRVLKGNSDSFEKRCKNLLQNEPTESAFSSHSHFIEASASTETNNAACSFSFIAAREIERRHLAVSSLSAAEACLDILFKSVCQLNISEPGKNLIDGVADIGSSLSDEIAVDPLTWNQLRSRNLSYFLDKRTIRLLAGANLILSAPEDQCAQVLGRLSISADDGSNFSEAVELLLLGCAARKWEILIEHFMSTPYVPVILSKLCKEVFNLVAGGCKNICCNDSMMSSKDRSVIRFLESWLSSRLPILWKLSPILAAFSIPSWSQLFRSYLRELESHLRGGSSVNSSCSCANDAKEHIKCDAVDRVWCLYIYHICGSN
ncbi:hypothetical protein DM860_012587 [Cuscuta australis]|uniref:Uncharacterized protein n=1 Tax=Cuscuta australis TaxID=267555 RepID=A0A328DD67_9ASTE|nr:hypothetical protein DM860_012587 [Cuscuta australis]